MHVISVSPRASARGGSRLLRIVFNATACVITFASGVSHAALAPPAEFVRDPNDPSGNTLLTLEEAGILNADGRQHAIALGKALFWDLQAGSDGNACASCHNQAAGADLRIINQEAHAGLQRIMSTAGIGGDTTFGSTQSDTGDIDPVPDAIRCDRASRTTATLTRDDFPLHMLLLDKERIATRRSRRRPTTRSRRRARSPRPSVPPGAGVSGARDKSGDPGS